MADYGFDFRATSGYVTDPANCSADVGTGATYPNVYGNGATAGWDSSILDSRDRNSGNDARLAGDMFLATSAARTFRIDLPSTGSYDIRMAIGDASYSIASTNKWELFDNASSLATATGGTSASQRFLDATNTEYTNATWSGSNTAITKTFTSTILNFKIGDGTNTAWITHLRVTTNGGVTTEYVAAVAEQHIGSVMIGRRYV